MCAKVVVRIVMKWTRDMLLTVYMFVFVRLAPESTPPLLTPRHCHFTPHSPLLTPLLPVSVEGPGGRVSAGGPD